MVDLGRIELPPAQCECAVMPLYYRPFIYPLHPLISLASSFYIFPSFFARASASARSSLTDWIPRFQNRGSSMEIPRRANASLGDADVPADKNYFTLETNAVFLRVSSWSAFDINSPDAYEYT